MTTETAYPFTAGQFNDLTDEQREAVEAVAEFLTGYTVSEGTDLSDVEITRALNLLTPSEGCVPAEELDPDILEAIHKKFNAVFSVGTELADMELIKQGFEPFKHFSFCPIIEPSYDDASHIVIVDYQEPICYLHEWHKAWDFHFETLHDLADAVLNVKHHLVKQVTLTAVKDGRHPIYVIVSGGLVQNVQNAPSSIEVVVIDYDVEGAEPDEVQPSPTDGQPCCLSSY